MLRASIPQTGQLVVNVYQGAVGGLTTGTWSLGAASGSAYVASVGQSFEFEHGRLTLSTADAGSTEMKGDLEGRLRMLVPVRGDAGWSYVQDPNGPCLDLAATAIDTTVALGTSCTGQPTCGNQKSCSVRTQTCIFSECSSPSDCGDGGVCLRQTSPLLMCTYPCGPYTACPSGSGLQCDLKSLRCLNPGSSDLADPCLPDDTTTGCRAGLQCKAFSASSRRCVTACNPLTATANSTPCASNQRCLPEGRCDAVIADASPSLLGALCTSTTEEVLVCGDDGASYRGLCSEAVETVGGRPIMRCRPVCHPLGLPCASGTCRQVFGIGGERYACLP